MTVTIAQLRAGRALLDWTTTRLASVSQVHRETIGRIESGCVRPQNGTKERLVTALEKAGVVFAENGMIGIKADILRFSATTSRNSDQWENPSA